jgi:hypothetical protein
MRPLPDGLVNSPSSMPILRNTHSSPSTSPVEMAVSGMSPSDLLRGKEVETKSGLGLAAPPTNVVPAFGFTVLTTGIAVLVHALVTTVICLRQRPSWMTTGMF